MALAEYKRKRKFERTPEPTVKRRSKTSAKTPDPLRFVVQEHYASHHHFDFRLELDGVLKSWAVPKGPSMDPDVKRLAMMVEDHPLDYASFQGTIPEGNYGAGEVRIWDKGVYQSSKTPDPTKNVERLRYGLDKGHLEIILLGEKLKGSFSLIKIKNDKQGLPAGRQGNAWLLIKHKDEYARTNDPVPHDVQPMLATLSDKPFNDPDWIFEIKWDGYRAIAEIEYDEVKLYSRKGNSFLDKYPVILNALKKLKRDLVLDGEIVALKDGRPDFHSLQNYKETPAPLQYVLFDLLYMDGRDLRNEPLIERKRLLREIVLNDASLSYSDHVKENGIGFFEQIKKEQFEGMIAKDGGSSYLEGKRSTSWLKFKHFNEQEAIIVGYTAPRGSRKKLGALVLAAYDAYDNKELKYIGHSGGGFTGDEIDRIHEMLSKIRVRQSPLKEKVPINSPITWVKPKYVCQIKYGEWTPDYRMRHPIFAGLREDKDPSEVKIERPGVTIDKSMKKSASKSPDEPNLTNLDKVFWPKEGYTKGDVISYYEKMSDVILPYLKDRPESLHRHPNGINGKSFFHKDIEMKVPNFVETKKIWSDSNEKEINYLLCQNKETLMYLANLGCIELNPWNSRVQNLDKPDYMIIDLDPNGRPFEDLIKVAKITHELLEIACEESYVKTSGKTGLHILVPLGAQYDYDTIRTFSQLLVTLIHRKIPAITSIERSPSKRRNKIYLDYLQNRRGQTIAVPYSIRPVPGATVSTPLEWKEVTKGLDPRKFTVTTIWKRLDKVGDLWKPVLRNKVDLAESIKCLEQEINP